MKNEFIEQAAQMLLASGSTLALTGAGASTESGIPDFRGPKGLWTKVDPMKFASINSFLSDPKGWWEMALELAPTLLNAKPNPTHKMLAKLEKMKLIHWVVTQNVDGLHQQAGSTKVLEVHGSLFSATCTVCQHQETRKYLEKAMTKRRIPVMCPTCGGLMKLDAVFFGESLPQKILAQAISAARTCQLFIAIGSSLVVYPVATLPTIAQQAGATFIIINQEPTPLDAMADLVIHAEAGSALTEIFKEIRRQQRST